VNILVTKRESDCRLIFCQQAQLGYFQKNLNLWDIAAGIIIVKEAGGQVNDLNLKQNNNIDITASSSSINEKLLKNLINF